MRKCGYAQSVLANMTLSVNWCSLRTGRCLATTLSPITRLT
jgi:hypothetical protein